jgi:hypothetical protein
MIDQAIILATLLGWLALTFWISLRLAGLLIGERPLLAALGLLGWCGASAGLIFLIAFWQGVWS